MAMSEIGLQTGRIIESNVSASSERDVCFVPTRIEASHEFSPAVHELLQTYALVSDIKLAYYEGLLPESDSQVENLEMNREAVSGDIRAIRSLDTLAKDIETVLNYALGLTELDQSINNFFALKRVFNAYSKLSDTARISKITMDEIQLSTEEKIGPPLQYSIDSFVADVNETVIKSLSAGITQFSLLSGESTISIQSSRDYELLREKIHLIDHQLRNPFGAFCLFFDMEPSEPVNEVFPKMMQSHKMIREIMETGRRILLSNPRTYTSKELGTAIHDVLKYSTLIDHQSIKISLGIRNLSDEDSIRFFDHDLLTFFLMNIFDNAIKAHSAKDTADPTVKSIPEVNISIYKTCTDRNTPIHLAFTDNGCGYHPSVLAEGFSSGHTVWPGQIEGTGIGLDAIVTLMRKITSVGIAINNRPKRGKTTSSQIIGSRSRYSIATN